MTTVEEDALINRRCPVSAGDAGRMEVKRCRRRPAHRAHSLLRRLTSGPWLLVALRIRIVRSSLLGRMLSRSSHRRTRAYAKLPLLGRLMRRFLQSRDSIIFYRAAIEEAGGWKPFQQEFALRVPVLCYHHIGEKAKGSWPLLTLSPAVLEDQMRWLAKRGYTGISASAWLAWLQRGSPLPEKPVVLTFDDAYSDLVQTALPILRQHRFQATLFLVSRHIGGASTWDAELGYPSRPLMSRGEILSAMKSGVEVGSHTRTHRNLRHLSEAELNSELELSRGELTRLTGDPVRVMAYPFGSEDRRVRECAAKFYDLAFSCRPGLNRWDTDQHRLHRMFVHRSRLNFALQVKFGVDLYAIYRFFPDRLHTLWRRVVVRAKSRGELRFGAVTEQDSAGEAGCHELAAPLARMSANCPQTSSPVRLGKADLS